MQLNVAIIGARGIPATYGGFDTLVEELSVRLVRDHAMKVTVYCRTDYYIDRPKYFSGVECVYISAPRIKGAESLIHTFLSSLHALRGNYDLIFIVDPGNAPIAVMLKMLGKIVIVHTDGLGWKRRKWGFLARRYYRWVEWVSARIVNNIITDNQGMADYYEQNYHASSVQIAYGASSPYGVDEAVFSELALVSGSYLLVVARLEPENNVDVIIREFVAADVEMPLVIVGGAPYGEDYLDYLRSLANEKVVFAGAFSDQAKLNALYKGAYLYIHGHEVGGTNPSLLRAMGFGTAPIVMNVDYNRYVVGPQGLVFSKQNGNLAAALVKLATDATAVGKAGQNALDRVNKEYNWESVSDRYAEYFRSLLH
jgi:glycosyltransferase involved in cell wall biosynthesis